MIENDVTEKTISLAIKIHRALGPGLLESVYEEILCYEFEKENIKFIRQASIPVIYEEVQLKIGFRADIIIENKVIIELKSVDRILPVHKKQLLTYLKITNIKLGLLINFNENLLKDGITRIANNL